MTPVPRTRWLLIGATSARTKRVAAVENPAPDAELTSVGQENFDWVVETAANFAIKKAQTNREGKDNLTWGEFMKRSAN